MNTEAIAAVVVAVVFIAIGATMAWLLFRVADRRPDAMVTVSLSLLTLAALAGSIATNSKALEVVVGTGVGALATALTGLFRATKQDDGRTAPDSPPPAPPLPPGDDPDLAH